MTTIIRVKRHRGEDPVEALVLSCKRKKTDDGEESNVENSENKNSNLLKYILNFSGTVEDKDNKTAATTVECFRKDTNHSDLKSKEHMPDIKTKQRKEWKERSDDSRFTLLSCLRSSNSFRKTDDDFSCDQKKSVTIVDVSRENNESLPSNSTADSSFVYDLYSTNIECDSDYNDMFMEHLLSVQPLQTELDYRNGEDCYDEIDPDEDDSNDENNWRNDYPDSDIFEDDEEDESGDILARQFNRCHIDDDDRKSSSSDSDNERYFNYDDNEKYCYYEAEDLAGRRYARYKANAMKMMMMNHDDEDEESNEDFRDGEDSLYGDGD